MFLLCDIVSKHNHVNQVCNVKTLINEEKKLWVSNATKHIS